MATTSAAIPWSAALAENALPPLRQLWQVPAFVAGVVALVVLCTVRPPWTDPAARQMERELTEARRLLAEPQPDLDRVKALTEGVLSQGDRSPRRSAVAHFLLGSAIVKLAEKNTGAAAAEHYQLARSHLEQAESLGVSDEDRPRLRYRLGKVAVQLQDDPRHVLDYLADSVEQGADDPIEGYMLLAQAYLHLPKPNLEAALEANGKLLALPITDDAILAPARLQKAELLTALKDPVGARKALELVKPPAPPEVLARARRLLARSYQDEDRWPEAAALWKELAADANSPRDLNHALCQLGTCYRHTDQPDEAIRAWERVLEQANPEEEQAAALGLGEVRLGREPARALADFERAVRNVRTPDDWKNGVIDLKEGQQRFELACRQCRQSGRYEVALRLSALYERLAPPGMGQCLWAQAAGEWAQTRLQQTHGPEEEQATRDLFRQAGTRYEAAAVPGLAAEERGRRLWEAVHCYLEGRDSADVPRALGMLAQTGQLKERLGEGWYRLAEVHRALAATKPQPEADAEERAALHAFGECKLCPGKYAYRARYELAMQLIREGNVDEAQNELLRNQSLLAVEMDTEAHEKTVFALANLLYRRQLYLQAVSRLQNALDVYKNSEHAPILEARFELANCFYHLAEHDLSNIRESNRLKPETEAFYREQYQSHLGDAATAYSLVYEMLSDRGQKRKLTASEENLMRTVMFATADCRVLQGHYEDGALPMYLNLAGLYHNRVERLHALAGKRQCYWLMAAREKDPPKKAAFEREARATLEEIGRALEELGNAAFEAKLSRWTRQDWDEWVEKERHNDNYTPPNFNNGRYVPEDPPFRSGSDGG